MLRRGRSSEWTFAYHGEQLYRALNRAYILVSAGVLAKYIDLSVTKFTVIGAEFSSDKELKVSSILFLFTILQYISAGLSIFFFFLDNGVGMQTQLMRRIIIAVVAKGGSLLYFDQRRFRVGKIAAKSIFVTVMIIALSVFFTPLMLSSFMLISW